MPPDEMHYVRAADLARGLANASIPGVGKVERIIGSEASHFYDKIFGRTGMIYIQDYWRRHGETTSTGDHIDVWNGYRSSTKWLMEWFEADSSLLMIPNATNLQGWAMVGGALGLGAGHAVNAGFAGGLAVVFFGWFRRGI